MARLSRQTRENIKIGAVLVVAALLITVYIIYPLNRSKALMGRTDIDDFNPDSLGINSPSPFAETGLLADTARIETDGLTRIACLYLGDPRPKSSSRGTVILVPDDRQTRDSLVRLASLLADTGFMVITYDQRASGRSPGLYHGGGQLEAGDLEAVIAYYELRGKIPHPLIVAGFAAGADAALLAQPEGRKIEGIVAVNPSLTTDGMLDQLYARHGTYWFPFRSSVIWWWYNIRSSSAAVYRHLDAVAAVSSRTVLVMSPEQMNDPAVLRLVERSDPELLRLRAVTNRDEDLVTDILSLAAPKP